MAEERFELEKIPPPRDRTITIPAYPSYPDAAPYGYGTDDEKLYLRRIWRAIWKYKWLIAVLAIIATTVVTIQVFRVKSMYQASATIEIGKENRTLVRTGQLAIETEEADSLYEVSLIMKTKIRVIESRPLLEQVVTNLKLDQNPKFLEVTQDKSIWEAVKTIGNRVGMKSHEGAEMEIVPTVPVKSEKQGTNSAAESARLAPYVDIIASNLSADHLQDTRMLVISFKHTDPEIAAAVANNIAEVFVSRDFMIKTEKFTGASEWLSRSTRELEARVQQAEEDLVNYSRANNIYSTEGGETLTMDKLSRLHDQATRAETDRILKQSLYEEVKAGRVAQLPESFADAKTLALQEKLGALAIQAAELDVKYGPKNPNVIAIRQQIASIEKQMDTSRSTLELRLKADYERAVRDETLLKAALDRAKGEAVQQNQATIQYNILRQKVETAKALYTDFLQKHNQAKIQAADQHNNFRLIDPARVPVAPIGPRRLRSIATWLILSLVAGAGLALLLDYLDNTIKTSEDVNRYVQLPTLGVIPLISKRTSGKLLNGGRGRPRAVPDNVSMTNSLVKANRLADCDDRSSLAEAYRVLRTSVLLSVAGKPPKKILFTSGRPGEGKTTTTVNTAISLAQLGSPVLIIDCDLRKPWTHKLFNINPIHGLSTYLSRDADVDDFIQELSIPNLSLLPCGRIPPNPAELLSSPKMKELLETLSERYEHILIDSPPLMNVTDPVILSTLSDGVILVVNGGKSKRQVVRRARQELSNVGANILGVVLNGVELGSDEYDYYYYGRYYSSYTSEKAASAGD